MSGVDGLDGLRQTLAERLLVEAAHVTQYWEGSKSGAQFEAQLFEQILGAFSVFLDQVYSPKRGKPGRPFLKKFINVF